MEIDNRTGSVTRRTAIGRGIAFGLVSAGAKRALAATLMPMTAGEENHTNSELFAFPGGDENTTVIALTMVKNTEYSKVRIHAGSHEFTFGGAEEKRYRFPVFTGEVMAGEGGTCSRHNAIVLQAPNEMLRGMECTGIWAEIFTADGRRRRVGSPFLVPLLKQQSRVSAAYHAICPEQDFAILLEDVADLIAANVKGNSQIADARSYGLRLASELLPDVLHYNPALPHGFSFAARNGRYPGECAAAIVDTTLRGAPVFGRPNDSPPPVTAFPYFRLPASAA